MLTKYNKTWDGIIKEMMYLDMPIQRYHYHADALFTVAINGYEIWCNNYPSSFGYPYTCISGSSKSDHYEKHIRGSLYTNYLFKKWILKKLKNEIGINDNAFK